MLYGYALYPSYPEGFYLFIAIFNRNVFMCFFIVTAPATVFDSP